MAVPYHVRFARQIFVCYDNNIVDIRMRQTYNQQPQASHCDRDATGRERNEPFPGKDARGMFDRKGRSIEDWISMTARLSLAGVRYTADLWRLAIAIPARPCPGGVLVEAGRGAVRVMECGVLHDGTLTEPDDFLSISFGPGSAVEVEARERRENDR